MHENDSLLEIAIELMEKKRKPHTLQAIIKDCFELKGMKASDHKEEVAQFEMDFMLCGRFICCGEDPKKGYKLWDLKERQNHELLDKEDIYTEDIHADDEDVQKNELKDDPISRQNDDNDYDSEYNQPDIDDDEEDEDENDDIEEEMLMNGIGYEDEEDSPEDSYDDDDNNI